MSSSLDVSVTFSTTDLNRIETAAEALLSPLAYEQVDDWRRAVTRALKHVLDSDGAMFTLVPAIEPGVNATFNEESGGVPFPPPPSEQTVFGRTQRGSAGRPARQAAGMQAACRSTESVGVVVVTRESAHPFGEPALAILRLLQPALAVGIEMRQRFARRRAEFLRVLDAMREGLVLVDSRGRILHETPAVARMLADERERDRVRSAMLACARGVLSGDRPAEPSGLRGVGPARRTLSLARTSSEVRTSAQRYRMRACFAGDELAGSPAVLVSVERVSVVVAPDDATLRARFGLTPREIEVTRLLAVGQRNDDVAASLRISPHTARRHTERVLAKLGATSRAAVGALLRGA